MRGQWGIEQAEHTEQIDEMVEIVRSARIFSSLDLLGAMAYMLPQQRLTPSRTGQSPRDAHEMRCFFGLTKMTSIFCKLVKGYASRVVPLDRLLQKTMPYRWTQQCQQALEDLRSDLTEAPDCTKPAQAT